MNEGFRTTTDASDLSDPSNGASGAASQIHPRFAARIDEVKKQRLETVAWDMVSIYCLLKKAANEIGKNEGLVESLRADSLSHQSENICNQALRMAFADRINFEELSALKDRCLALQDRMVS